MLRRCCFAFLLLIIGCSICAYPALSCSDHEIALSERSGANFMGKGLLCDTKVVPLHPTKGSDHEQCCSTKTFYFYHTQASKKKLSSPVFRLKNQLPNIQLLSDGQTSVYAGSVVSLAARTIPSVWRIFLDAISQSSGLRGPPTAA
jgi:hypothetical protein